MRKVMLKHIIIRLLIFLIPITFNKISGQDAFKVKEKEEIQRIIEDYIMANPEVITPPGLFMYSEISFLGSSDSKKSN